MEALRPAQRTGLLKPSPTLGITGKAQAMRKAGRDIVSFAAGEPDFNTPDPICAAGISAIEAGYTKYTPSAGAPDLRSAVAERLGRDRGVKYAPEQVVISCGAKHSLFNAITLLVDPGDEVILFAPFWMTYRDQVQLLGGRAVVVPCSADGDFLPDLDRLRAAITPRTKAILLNSPSNPTGAVFTKACLMGIAQLALEHGLWIISDEIYEDLVYEGQHVSIASVGGDEIADRSVIVSGCSKSYSMTGWRIGYAAMPATLARFMSDLQDQVTSNPSSISQRAALAALAMDAESTGRMRKEFHARRDLMVDLLNAIPGMEVRRPQGAFYVFPSVLSWLRGGSDAQLAEQLLEEQGVATIPGSVFEGAGHIRLSYAASRDDIQKGVARVADFLEQRRG